MRSGGIGVCTLTRFFNPKIPNCGTSRPAELPVFLEPDGVREFQYSPNIGNLNRAVDGCRSINQSCAVEHGKRIERGGLVFVCIHMTRSVAKVKDDFYNDFWPPRRILFAVCMSILISRIQSLRWYSLRTLRVRRYKRVPGTGGIASLSHRLMAGNPSGSTIAKKLTRGGSRRGSIPKG
jgi:hypothetical protein